MLFTHCLLWSFWALLLLAILYTMGELILRRQAKFCGRKMMNENKLRNLPRFQYGAAFSVYFSGGDDFYQRY